VPKKSRKRGWLRRSALIDLALEQERDEPGATVKVTEVDDIPELFGHRRPYVTTSDGISHLGIVGRTDWDYDEKKWWATVKSWDGVTVYDGPAPIPEGIAELSIDELMEGKAYQITMKPVDA
jgi:hypothetical protein